MTKELSRRLAAIMFTDIQGYTAMMQKDEEYAMSIRERHRQVFQKTHQAFKGEILQYYGDGTLSIFDSSLQAVRCAIAIQRELKLAPEVPLRIGIHIGDIIITGEDVIGDGVNLASRIENLAFPGSVFFSGEVQRQVKNNGILTRSMGKFRLKNVAEPVEIFAAAEEGLFIPNQEQIVEKGHELIRPKKHPLRNVLKAPYLLFIGSIFLLLAYFFVIRPLLVHNEMHRDEKKASETTEVIDRSIAVLPFINLSDDPDQEYFSDGIMDEILNNLYQIGGLRIPSRTSSMRYKGVTDKSIQQMGKELGVSYALEGSVSRSGNRVRIIVQLINVKTDDHMWSQDYEEEFEDVFGIQKNIAQQVARELKAQISPEVKERMDNIPTKNFAAYNLFLQARFYLTEVIDRGKAKPLLDEAIQLDSNFAEAYALLGYYWLLGGSWLGELEPHELLDKALPLLNKAKSLNRNYSITYAYLSQAHLWYQWDFEAAAKYWRTFFRLSPSNMYMNSSYSDFLNASGRSAESTEIIDQAILHDPSYSNWGSGLSYYFNGQPQKAIQHYETAMNLFPNDGIINGLGRVYVYTGRYQEAIELLEAYSREGNDYPRPLANLAIAYFNTGQQSRADSVMSILEAKSKVTSVGSPAFYTGMICAQMEKPDLAFEWLNKAYDHREVEMYWLKVEPPFEPIRTDPRWEKMLDQVGFSDF